jgi:quinol---cytochrome c reductase iron-sulfur subunit, bacillus type
VAADRKKKTGKRSPYTADRGIPGAYKGETMTRRTLVTGGAMAAGGVATAAFALPALGFALGPIFTDPSEPSFQDVGATTDFNADSYVPRVITLPDSKGTGEASKSTVYVREFNPQLDTDKLGFPYVAISTRCMHLGCPVRYVQASQRFICPCHGGVYSADGAVAGGPPVRPLDRFVTRVEGDRVLVGDRFSLDSHFDRFSPRDPGEPLDGLWQWIYPPRPTV